MTGEIGNPPEGIGETAASGSAARAAEPEHDDGDGHTHEGACLNCGTPLTGPHCHTCGQRAHVHRTLGAFSHDLLHGALHFEGKTWRTLPKLAVRPGELTRRYIAGERARFVSPIALLLFSVFLMFAVFSTIGGPYAIEDVPARIDAARDLRQSQARVREELQTLTTERDRLRAASTSATAVDRRIKDVEDELRALEISAAFTGADGEQARASQDDTFRKVVGEIATGENDLPPQVQAALKKAAETNLSLLLYKIQANAYKFSWALIPISGPFVWLLFLHRRKYRAFGAYDHTVFVTYSIAFMSLMLVALSLLRPLGLGKSLIDLAIVLIPPIHIYRQLRGAYGIGRWSAAWRAFVLLIFSAVAATLFFMLLLTLGVLG